LKILIGNYAKSPRQKALSLMTIPAQTALFGDDADKRLGQYTDALIGLFR